MTHEGAIGFGGLRYLWHADAFLSERQAAYGLEQLWRLCAGEADWEGPPVVDLPAMDRRGVEDLHDLGPQELPWGRLAEMVPPGFDLPADLGTLPLLCQAPTGAPGVFAGTGAFPLDLVAATFLGLTRWEEARTDWTPDPWGNWHSSCSLAGRQGFLDRPVIDEWALVLRAWLSALKPGWSGRPRAFDVAMTHDLDHVRKYPSWRRVFRSAAGQLVRRRRPIRALTTAASGVRGCLDPAADPYVTGLSDLLDLDEELGCPGLFYFMTARPSTFDSGYEIKSPDAVGLLARIRERGHHEGWHTGYLAAEDDAVFQQEHGRAVEAFGAPVDHVRFHYLRWRVNRSWARLAEAGIRHDGSLGFNDTVGFRCGTSHPFPVYDLASDGPLPVVETPLVVQEDCLIDGVGQSRSAAAAELARLRDRTRRVGGCLTILVHNSYADSQAWIPDLFREALSSSSR